MKNLLLFICLALCLAACTDDELSTSPSDQPTPSADTIHLGTLLGGNSSQTYQLKLYNHCDKELRLTSISLRNAETSGFRINVDGMNGTSFTQSNLLRIASGDSLFIFVEATFNESFTETYHLDYVDIVCNQRTQTVVLDAATETVEILHSPSITSNTTWMRGKRVQIYDSLVVAEGVTLTLEDSVTLYLHDGANIVVYGTLLCQGKLSAPVTLRGDRTDNMFDNLAYDGLPSQWGNLYIDAKASNCRFDYTDIRGMNEGIFIDSTQVVFNSCRIKNSSANLITCYQTTMTLQNSELSNTSNALLALYGGSYDITHCTLANYNFWKATTEAAVHLCNIDTAASRYTPLYKCNFVNTLIWGRWVDTDVNLEYYDVALNQDEFGNVEYADSIFSYHFDHCLLKADGYDDDDFVQTVWNQDPLYSLIDHPNYSYDFHLQADSPAREAGTGDGVSACPSDLDGISRPSIPSIGCYQWYESQ